MPDDSGEAPQSPPYGFVLVDVPRSPGGSLISLLQEALDNSVDKIDRVLFGLSAAELSNLAESLEFTEDKRDDPI